MWLSFTRIFNVNFCICFPNLMFCHYERHLLANCEIPYSVKFLHTRWNQLNVEISRFFMSDHFQMNSIFLGREFRYLFSDNHIVLMNVIFPIQVPNSEFSFLILDGVNSRKKMSQLYANIHIVHTKKVSLYSLYLPIFSSIS